MVETVQKQKQERTRSPEIKVFRRYAEGVSFPETLKLVDEAKRVLVSNKRHDKALVGSDEWKGIKEVYPCWTGTMTGYEKKNKKLGKKIVYTDPHTKQRYIFPTDDAKGSKNVILVAEHPNYELVKDGKDLIVKASTVNILENFPVLDDWYFVDSKHGIPYGEEVSKDNENARYLWRTGKRVGPVGRGYYGLDYDGRHYVLLVDSPSIGLGVAVEAFEGRLPTKLQVEPEAKLRFTEDKGKLIIEGTPEDISRIKALLKK